MAEKWNPELPLQKDPLLQAGEALCEPIHRSGLKLTIALHARTDKAGI